VFLNHGSFGACPRAVLEAQAELRARMEREPVRFMLRELEPALDAAREALGEFVGAAADDLAFVRNTTAAVSTVLASLTIAHRAGESALIGPGDELLTTDHAYGACRNALDRAAARVGARVTVARLPLPLRDAAQVRDAVLAAVTVRTRFALIDHVTSPTALILPVSEIARALEARGVTTMIDGAHAPGMVPLDVHALGATYYAGNCHKWICAPKGAAFLWVRRDARATLRPLVTSHGATSPRARDPRSGRDAFREEFDWTGTDDPTPALTVPVALRAMASLVPGGWPEIMARNHALALEARAVLLRALPGHDPLAPPSMLGSMATVALPSGAAAPPRPALGVEPLQAMLLDRFGIEVPVFRWPTPVGPLLRVSAQLYDTIEEYEYLAAVLPEALAAAAT
jgi:isopenicillin-N epimerase